MAEKHDADTAAGALEAAEARHAALHEELRAAAARAEAAARRAEQASVLKDEFLATVSHELRTPLSSILNWAQTLTGERRFDPQHVERAATVIERNARAQLRLVEDLLDVSQIIRGQLRIDTLPVVVDAIAQEALESVRPSAEAKQIALELAVPEGCRLVGDPDRLRQILWNLLSNAVKFTPQGGRVELRIEQVGPRVTIAVTDTGCGIEPSFLPRVFERFSQGDSGPSRVHGGLGLGLAVVRHLAEMHGGTVAATSEGTGRGSTFVVTLPVRPFTAEVRADAATSEPSPPSVRAHVGRLAGLRVLVVEDEPDSRELIEVLLTSEGAQVEAAGSAEEALEKLEAFDPQLLVSDIGMPRHDGTWLVRQVHDRMPGLPSIALTAFTRREEVAKILAAGFDHHVGKPVDPERLVDIVVRIAARQTAPDGYRRG